MTTTAKMTMSVDEQRATTRCYLKDILKDDYAEHYDDQVDDLLWRWTATEIERSGVEIMKFASGSEASYPQNLKVGCLSLHDKLRSFLEEELPDSKSKYIPIYTIMTLDLLARLMHDLVISYLYYALMGSIKTPPIEKIESHILTETSLGIEIVARSDSDGSIKNYLGMERDTEWRLVL